jgi:hypothetical protein
MSNISNRYIAFKNLYELMTEVDSMFNDVQILGA